MGDAGTSGTRIATGAIFTLGAGLFCLGVFFNEWTVTALFSADGELSARSRLAVWACTLSAVLAGVALIGFRKRLALAFVHHVKTRPRLAAFNLGAAGAVAVVVCVEVVFYAFIELRPADDVFHDAPQF